MPSRSAFFLMMLGIPATALGNLVLNVQPIAVYDSRFNGTLDVGGDAVFEPTGTYSYMPNINGPYVPTFESEIDTIYGQCMIDVNFLTTVTFDSSTYLNIGSSTELDNLLTTNGGADAAVDTFLGSIAGPPAHHMFFVNSHPNTPAGPSATADPMSGSWGTLSTGGGNSASAAGIALTPGVGDVANMRSVIAHSDDIFDATSEATWTNTPIPTVLAHELAHNLSLLHVAATDNLMYPGSDGMLTQYELTPSQCSDMTTTGLANLTAIPEPSSLAFGSLVLLLLVLSNGIPFKTTTPSGD